MVEGGGGGISTFSCLIIKYTGSVIQLQRSARLYFILMVRRTTSNQLSGRDRCDKSASTIFNKFTFFFFFSFSLSFFHPIGLTISWSLTVGFEVSTVLVLRRVLAIYPQGSLVPKWAFFFFFLSFLS